MFLKLFGPKNRSVIGIMNCYFLTRHVQLSFIAMVGGYWSVGKVGLCQVMLEKFHFWWHLLIHHGSAEIATVPQCPSCLSAIANWILAWSYFGWDWCLSWMASSGVVHHPLRIVQCYKSYYFPLNYSKFNKVWPRLPWSETSRTISKKLAMKFGYQYLLQLHLGTFARCFT